MLWVLPGPDVWKKKQKQKQNFLLAGSCVIEKLILGRNKGASGKTENHTSYYLAKPLSWWTA